MATLTDVDTEAMRQRLVVKESLTQAFKEPVRQKLQEPNFLMSENSSNNGGYIYRL